MSLRGRAASLAKIVELLVYPSACRLCGRSLELPGEKIVCRECLGLLVPRRGPACLCCGRFFDGDAGPHLCPRCLSRPPDFALHRSCGPYDGVLKDLILLYKYRRFSVLGRVLAGYAGESLGGEEGLWQGAGGLVPVPLHPARRRERGFNQARLLARELGRARGIEVLDRCLVKTRNTPPQTTLEAEERLRNVRGAYRVRRPGDIRGKTVILVDDVFTTGATLGECGRVLRLAGAGEVRALSLAQA